MAFDLLIFQTIRTALLRVSFFDFLWILLGAYLPWVIGFAVLAVLWRIKDRRERAAAFLFTAFTALVSRGVFTEPIRFFAERLRPYELLGFEPLFFANGSSFPSGHAAFFFALAFAVWHFRPSAGKWFFLAATVISLARMFSGLHWFSDILGGFILAWIAYLIGKFILPGTRHRESA